MTLQQYRNSFKLKLNSLYPEEEIGSFFYLLSEKYLKLKRVDVALELQRQLSSIETANFDNALRQLLAEVPIQYILGDTEFYGLPFLVNSSVLIPRPETEELVDWILKNHNSNTKTLKILDVGTGSGCIAISLAKFLKNADVVALDVSTAALKTAKTNASLNGVAISFIEKDVLSLDKLENEFDVIVSNPPYVTISEKTKMQANVVLHEPQNALFVSNENPLIFYSKITELAITSLKPSGSLYFEINEAFGNQVVHLLQENGFENVVLKEDVYEKSRMVKGSKPSLR